MLLINNEEQKFSYNDYYPQRCIPTCGRQTDHFTKQRTKIEPYPNKLGANYMNIFLPCLVHDAALKALTYFDNQDHLKHEGRP